MPLTTRIIFFIFALGLLLAACIPGEVVAPSDPWSYGDLRILSPGDLEEAPDLDLIAAYTRFTGSDWQIRLDLLDMNENSTFDLFIALDTSPGGIRRLPGGLEAEIEWDFLLFLPDNSSALLISAEGVDEAQSLDNLDAITDLATRWIPRISRLPLLDSVVISVNKYALPFTGRGVRIQAFITRPGSLRYVDLIGPFHSSDPPPRKALLLFAFWNTFPAYTPAQSLRRWDGAHTGPFGERHGLSVLLHAVRRSRVPVTLLDLKNPASISALDYLGVLSLVRELAEEKLLVLPDPLPGSPSFPLFPTGLPDWAVTRALEDVRKISSEFDLPASDILYSPRWETARQSQYSYIFTIVNDFFSSGYPSSRLFPIPFEKSLEPQADESGLSLSVRKTLLENAINRSPDADRLPLLILGGSFPDSPFGDPEVVSATLNYVAGHPWIHPLNADDLTASTSPGYRPLILPGFNYVPNLSAFTPSPMLLSLTDPGEDPTNPLLLAAWQAALSLYNTLPPEPFDLPPLRSIYSNQVVILSRAALWADDHMPRNTCATDPDRDNIPECTLASDVVYTISGKEGVRLLAMFVSDELGVHQIIAPTTDFIVGYTDPSTWDFNAGEGAETNGVHGAFADNQPPWALYLPSSDQEWLSFTHKYEFLEKTFTLMDSGLRIDYHSRDPITLQIPVALDPWNRFKPDWGTKYHGEEISNGYSWEWDDGPRILVRSNARMRTTAFTASRPYLGSPENPNFAYPVGHYIPFPVLLIELRSFGDFYIEITLDSD